MVVAFLLNILPMNFYEKPLSELSEKEWELICMRCGKCCMCKYSDDGMIHFSNHMCQFFDIKKGICSCYNKRFDVAKDCCKKVSMDLLEHDLDLLPPTCAYRRLYEGKGLPDYHPLLTKNPRSVEKAKATVKFLPVFSENALTDAVFALMQSNEQKHLDVAEIKQYVRKLQDQFKLEWLETYPRVNHVEETAI